MYFFDLSSPLRERWWAAITLDEREQIEEEFRETKSLEVPEPYRHDYTKMLTFMDPTFWTSLKDGLCGDKKEQVKEAMKAYLDVSAESNRLEDEFYAFNEANKSCTDDEKVGKHCEEKCRYENDLHYIQIQEAVLYDDLLKTIGL
jgi:hypothetical protein